MELKSRSEIPEELTWDLSAIYATEEEMYQDVEKLKNLCEHIVQTYKDKLNSARTIDRCLDEYRELQRLLALTTIYCDLAVSVDYSDTHNQERNDRLSRLAAEVYSQVSFIESQIIEQEEL